MQALQQSLTERQMAMASSSTPRAVPVLAADLRTLLRTEPEDGRAAALFAVDRAMRFGGGGLKSVAPADLKAALEQLDLIGCRTPGLGILRLQIARQIAAYDAREQAARVSAELRWLPAGAKPRLRRDARSTLQFESGFPDTVAFPDTEDKGK